MFDGKLIEVEGKIVVVFLGIMFKVEFFNGYMVFVYILGKLCKNFIKIVVGDKVKMEMSLYDLEKVCIMYCMKDECVMLYIFCCCY